ncbi:glycosyltransferase family 4 protein (plasmid) [Aliirhizobium terrae]|uniref:glycosyltransferase family 4 protein n=1 Tax=Terrirhizobium terrae TaxID=2926709 RepID=UPI00257619D3|nr:glycosyltransferase family 4 protein [Rhizobium sp. CC-CFT758]WJH37647.1 glycosyltransferase family 4 protein [Rhizobium sp. CC-CFT758]
MVFHGKPPSNTSLQAAEPPFSFDNIEVETIEFRVKKSLLVWQTSVFRYLSGRFDSVVIGHEFKFLSSLVILLASKLLRRPVFLWGFGYRKAYGSWDRGSKSGLWDRLALWAADRLALLGDGYIAYTETGRAHLLSIGVPAERIGVVRNTIDVEEQIALSLRVANEDDEAIRSEFGLRSDAEVLLYVGRLVPRKDIDSLIRFAKINQTISGPPVDILIIGDGEERERLEAFADGAVNIRFLGAIDPTDIRLARAMKLCRAVVIPGYLGLAVNHAFSHGRPVITRAHDFHSPEIEYLTDGRDGLIIAGDEAAFHDGLKAFLASPIEQKRLAENAADRRETLRMDYMVEAYDSFINQVVASVGRRR